MASAILRSKQKRSDAHAHPPCHWFALTWHWIYVWISLEPFSIDCRRIKTKAILEPFISASDYHFFSQPRTDGIHEIISSQLKEKVKPIIAQLLITESEVITGKSRTKVVVWDFPVMTERTRVIIYLFYGLLSVGKKRSVLQSLLASARGHSRKE